MLPTNTRKHANVHTLFFTRLAEQKNESPSKPYGQKLISLRAVLQCRDGILMPENPDGNSGQAESTQCESTCSTRTKTKGSLGAGGQLILDRDQDQWITGSRRRGSTRTKTSGSRGETRRRPGPWITGNTDSAGVSSTRTKSNGSTGGKQTAKEKAEQGKDGGNPKSYAPPASKDAADGASLPLRLGINT